MAFEKIGRAARIPPPDRRKDLSMVGKPGMGLFGKLLISLGVAVDGPPKAHHHLQLAASPGGGVETLVKGEVQRMPGVACRLSFRLRQQPLDRRNLARLNRTNRAGEEIGFEKNAKIVNFANLRRGELRHERAAIGQEFDQPLGLEPHQGIADGHPADAEAGGKVFLTKRSAGGNGAGLDFGSKRVRNQHRRRRVTVHVRIPWHKDWMHVSNPGSKRIRPMAGREHHYSVELEWTGNEGEGTKTYRSYQRAHSLAAPGKPPIPGSSDPNFRGDRTRWNPEELLLASISACHQLWYLHLCAEAGVVVTEYRDQASAVMIEEESGSGRFASALLRPEVVISPGSDAKRAMELHHIANEKCFVANSLNFQVLHKPVVRTAA